MTTLKFVHSNKITSILPHMTCNVNMILSTHTQIIRTSWYCSIRFHQGTPQNWKNHPVQIPTSCSFLLCCKEGWFSLPFPGLLMAKFPHCLQCIPLSPYSWIDWWYEGLYNLYQVWHWWGFNNICIKEEDQWKGGFITPFGLFEPTVMFFGFYNGLPTFQSFMNHFFADMIAEHWLKIYMDDLGIHIQGNLALHHEWTQCVLLHLREHGLSLKLSKCTFNVPCIEFLGMIIGQGKIEMDSVKLSTIKEWKPPASVKGVRSFLGFVNFYCKFIFFQCCGTSQLTHQKGSTVGMDRSPTTSVWHP